MMRATAILCGGIALLGCVTANADEARSTSRQIVLANAAVDGAAKKADEGDAAANALPLPPTAPARLTPAEQYCSSIVDAAAAAQIAQQTENLEMAKRRIEERVAVLAAKTEELKSWMKKREDFTAHAADTLIEIYSKMKPDAAANQLLAMDELTSAAIVSKLSPKVNSLILGEMDATKAARLTAIIANAGAISMKPEVQSRANRQ
ncbi:MotE family protein [Hyphomicrobium methylovorum]|uniref:MotE family protein n=1 Tax=Hyphomicrobium methylovorum TaxID=84 RepID=UPI0015E7CB5D|nr:MotE family protein [Hyphomicrobium methylovorum]